MSDEKSQGQGEDQKNQGDGGQDDNNDKEVIEMSKKDLSNKIIEGRNEGIEKGRKEAVGVLNETLGTEYDSLDTAKEDLSEKKVGNVEESEVVQELQDKYKKAQENIEAYENKIQDMRVEDQLKSSVSEALGDNDLSLPFDEARTLVDSKYGYVEKDGTLYATKDGDRFLNDSGDYMTYAEAFNNYVQSRGLIDGGSSGGTGGGSKPKSEGGSDNPFVSGNATEQARLWTENPQKAKRLKRKAGK